MSRLAAFLASAPSADWLTPERARIYGRLVALAMALGALGQFGQIAASARHDAQRRPMVTDFNAFWSGARLALEGHPADVYNLAAIRAAETVGAQPTGKQFLPYLYPPILLLLSLPIGLLPYLPAMLACAACLYLPCSWLLQRLLPPTWPSSVILALPASMMNATMGQSGFLVALAFATAALTLERRPALAGAALGLLADKPHLALCVPFALAAARRWKALASCGLTALALMVLSYVVLGDQAWRAYLRALPITRDVLLAGDIWPKLLSTYGAARILGGSAAPALAAQAACTVLALSCLVGLCLRRPGAGPEIAALTVSAMLCTPYVLDYDMVCLGVPMAWLACQGDRLGWRPWEKLLLAGLYLYPLEARNLNLLGLPATPLLLAMLLSTVASRAGLRLARSPIPAAPATAHQ